LLTFSYVSFSIPGVFSINELPAYKTVRQSTFVSNKQSIHHQSRSTR
jgi:hypothetical protein